MRLNKLPTFYQQEVRHLAVILMGCLSVAALFPSGATAQPNPAVSGAGCNNSNYDSAPTTHIIQLCNDPVTDGLFTEDGVTGYQYIYDYFCSSGCSGSFHLGGTDGPKGPAGTFQGDASAWYRTTSGGSFEGVWQFWSHAGVTDNGTDSHHQEGFGLPSAVVSTTNPKWTETDGAAVGDTNTDVWHSDVTYNPIDDWFAVGGTSPIGQAIPWAADNPWHAPSEYGYASEFKLPGFGHEAASHSEVSGSTGLAFREVTDVFVGGALHLQYTIRVVSPFAPGSVNWGIAADTYGAVTGPNGAPVPQSSCPDGVVGDADCDGDVDIGGDILPAFSNFTGPGSFGKTRAQGDVQGPVNAFPTASGHDTDVDVSDLLTMFGNFTGPLDGEAGEGGGLAASEAGDPSVPDLIYDALTGEVSLDVDGSGIIGYSLKSTGDFLPGGHTPILGGVTTSLATELAEAALSSPAGVNSIGLVLPAGLDLASLAALLTTNEVSRSLGAPIVPFDLVVINDVVVTPEPAAVVMGLMALAGIGMVAYRRRR